MAIISIVEATRIYACADGLSLQRHRIECPSLTAYSRALKGLRLSVGEESGNDYWREIMWRTYWYRKLACSAPLPPSHPVLQGADLFGKLKSLLTDCEAIAPRAAECARLMLSSLSAVIHENDNPLLSAIVELLDFEEPSGIAILTADSRLLGATQQILSRTPILERAEAIHVSELRTGKTFERLFFVGAAEWYGRGTLSAPRAPRVDVLRHTFVRDDWKHEPAFLGRQLGNRASPPSDAADNEVFSEDECEIVQMPLIDAQHIVRKIGEGVREGSHEFTLAKLVLLEGDVAVFLEADPDAKAFVIDLDAEGEDRVVRLGVASLKRGVFLLVRTQGGGDYIVSVADRILDEQAAAARASLNLWKMVLRSRVAAYGPAYVAKEIDRRGGERVDANDVCRWMSPLTIGTTNSANFDAILLYAGLDARHDQLWDLMRRTQSAHKQAGQQIRRLLLDEVEKVDLGSLRKLGTIEFVLPGRDAGSVTAYRIEDIVKEEFRIAPSRLSRPFHRGDASWLA